MSSGEVITFPAPRKRLRTKPGRRYVAIRLVGPEVQHLDRVANTLGISREDAAARMFRLGLRKFVPIDPCGGSAA